MSNTQTRIVNFDGEVVVAEKYETITIVKSELDAQAAALEARRAELNAQAEAVATALAQLEADRAALDEAFALYDRAKTEAELNAPPVMLENAPTAVEAAPLIAEAAAGDNEEG